MKAIKKQKVIGQVCIFAATIIWGSSFFILKNAMNTMPTFFVLSFRFLTAALFLLACNFRRMKNIGKTVIVKGLILGVVLSAAYGLQTVGLTFTTSSNNAFLTAGYCVITPFIAWLFFKETPDRYNLAAAVLCISGIGLICLGDMTAINIGDILTVISGIFYALQLILNSLYGKKGDVMQLLLVELTTCGVIFSLISTGFEPLVFAYSDLLVFENLFALLYLAVFCTFLAQLLQLYGQQFLSGTESSLILSLEAVFGTAFAVIFDGEKLTARLFLGFVIVFISLILSETKLSFLKPKNRKPKNNIE